MDAILGRLDPRQLRQFCVDAVGQELRRSQQLLDKALLATRRLEEVQEAARRLRFEVFNDEHALRLELHELNSVHHALGLLLARIQCVKAGDEALDSVDAVEPEHQRRGDPPIVIKTEPSSSSPPVTGEREFAQAIDLSFESEESDVDSDVDSDSDRSDSDSDSDASDPGVSEVESEESFTAETSTDAVHEDKRTPSPPSPPSRKRRSPDDDSESNKPPESSTEEIAGRTRAQLPELVAKLESVANRSTYQTTLLHTAKVVLVQMREPMSDRNAPSKTLWNNVTAVLFSAKSHDRNHTDVELDTLVIVVDFSMEMLLMLEPTCGRKRRQSLLLLQEAMRQANDVTGVLNRNVDVLREFLQQNCTSSAARTQRAKFLLEMAPATVAAWAPGDVSASSFTEIMNLLRELMTRKFTKWEPMRDHRVTALIIDMLGKIRLDESRSSQRERLATWLEHCATNRQRPTTRRVRRSKRLRVSK